MDEVKFRTLTYSEFSQRYEEAFNKEAPVAGEPGEVQIPGYGWKGCIISSGAPTHFYDEDDGWNPVPKGTRFKEIK